LNICRKGTPNKSSLRREAADFGSINGMERRRHGFLQIIADYFFIDISPPIGLAFRVTGNMQAFGDRSSAAFYSPCIVTEKPK